MKERKRFNLKEFKVNYKLLDGLFLTIDPILTAKNIKSFRLKRNKATPPTIGVQYDKRDSNTVININVIDDRFVQFLVSNTVSIEDIDNCDNEILIIFKDLVIDALELSKSVTLQDMMNIEFLNK